MTRQLLLAPGQWKIVAGVKIQNTAPHMVRITLQVNNDLSRPVTIIKAENLGNEEVR